MYRLLKSYLEKLPGAMVDRRDPRGKEVLSLHFPRDANEWTVGLFRAF